MWQLLDNGFENWKAPLALSRLLAKARANKSEAHPLMFRAAIFL